MRRQHSLGPLTNQAVNALRWFRPGEVIPDGQGGLLAGWTHVRNVYDYYARTPEARVTRVTPSGLTDYALPLPEWVSWRWFWVPPNRSLVLGENGVAFGTYGGKVVSFEVGSGTVRWTWQAPSGEAELVAATAGNGLVVKDGGRIARLDSNGVATYDNWIGGASGSVDPTTLSQLDYAWGTQWIALQTSPNPGTHPVAISAAAILWPWSVWSAPSIEDTRASIGPVEVRASKVVEVPIPVDFITDRVNSAITYWQENGRVLLSWNGVIDPEHACPPDWPDCPDSAEANIRFVQSDATVQEILLRRFPNPKGTQFVFVDEVGGANALTQRNVVIAKHDVEDVLPHEVGHVFGLAHVPKALNLMCGGWPLCTPTFSRELSPEQITAARRNSEKLKE